MKKKAQLEMGETMAVLFIFIILLVGGILFYVNLQKGSIKSAKEEVNVLNAIAVAEKASNLPELRCSLDNVQTDNCIDLIKAEAAGEVMNSKILHYYDMLGHSNISITRIFPKGDTIPIYSNIGNWTKKTSTRIPISLYDPLPPGKSRGEYTFGILTVEVYS